MLKLLAVKNIPFLRPNLYMQGGLTWAAGSIFHLLQAMLGLQADAPNRCLYVDPELPTWLPDITLRQLSIGNAMVDLRFWREDDRTRWTADVKTGEIDVRQRVWHSWQ